MRVISRAKSSPPCASSARAFRVILTRASFPAWRFPRALSARGLSIAAGTACGLRLSGDDARVFAVLGDGECEEGQVWEAAMFAAHERLGNLIAIVDGNGLQIDGKVCDVCDPGDLGAKFAAFGWDVVEVDGHDVGSPRRDALGAEGGRRRQAPRRHRPAPSKGKGVSFMEDQAGWHGKAPNAEQLKTALAELQAAQN